MVASLKGWALSGLTPAEEEYKRQAEAQSQSQRWSQTEEKHAATVTAAMGADGKALLAQRSQEQTQVGTAPRTGTEDATQGKGFLGSVKGWFGR